MRLFASFYVYTRNGFYGGDKLVSEGGEDADVSSDSDSYFESGGGGGLKRPFSQQLFKISLQSAPTKVNARNVSYTNLSVENHTISAFVHPKKFTAYSPTQKRKTFFKTSLPEYFSLHAF